jgi:hypothetical protein
MMVPFDPVLIVKELAKSGLGPAFGQLIKKRERDGFRIMEEAFQTGSQHPCTVDPESFAGMIYRYHRAMIEGTARVNLRIIANLIKGISSTDDLLADEFLHFADVIASFRREELVLLAVLYRLTLASTKEDQYAWDEVVTELVPHPFKSSNELAGIATGVARSGFLIDADRIGGAAFLLSPVGLDIIRMTAFESALEMEF